jgi:heme A synthase
MPINRFSVYTIFVLIWNLLVILWGAYVRATGSGAGCGSHWPLCNGEVLPRTPQIETIVEFTHRITSAIAILLVLVMVIWAFRRFSKGHPVRLGVVLSLIFIIIEALVGAGLVLFEWVADDISTGRVLSISIHLVNTFLLLAAITITIWWTFTIETINFNTSSAKFWLLVTAYLAVILLGMSGAITALGDTLFPSRSLLEGVRQDFDPASHIIIRLRIWHPVIAIITGSIILSLSLLLVFTEINKIIRVFALTLLSLFSIQLAAGMVNLILLAPVWMQIIHLLLADLVWIALIILGCSYGAFRIDKEKCVSNCTMDRKYVSYQG